MLEIESLPSFPTPSLEEWEDKIKRELKVTQLSELNWLTPEGIALKPLYQKLPRKEGTHGSMNGNFPSPSSFIAWECLFLGKNSPWKEQIQEALAWGITHFWLPAEGVISPDQVWAFFESIQETKLNISSDPNGKGMPNGTGELLPEKMEFSYFPGELGSSAPSQKMGWDLRNIYEGGGNLAHQLAVTLACLVQAYKKLGTDKFSSYISSLTLHLSVGTSFYREIAKYRVLPLLIKRLFEEWGLAELSLPAVMAHSTERDLGKNDSSMNAVRHSLACLAARLGGCQQICLHPLQEKPDIFQLRLARNIPILLMNEGKLQHVIDPVAGASFLEELGIAMGEKAWEHFLSIEEQGGLDSAWERGLIHKWMQTGREIEKELLKRGKKVRIGENKYRYEGN